ELAGLKKCNIAGLIDVSLNKQKYYSVHGRKIQDVSILKKAPPDSMMVISAVAHIKPIKDMLSRIGYQGDIITF
ncbi:MAG: hypothetical protein HY445_02165, partial [Candidatus Niyogibacteria bacterium]|nr:hypothetical protein [Candidatus Niyogibacteria bacterium]